MEAIKVSVLNEGIWGGLRGIGFVETRKRVDYRKVDYFLEGWLRRYV